MTIAVGMVIIMKVEAYIHSLKDREHDRHVLGEAEVNGVKCTAIFNFFTGHYYVDDMYGIQEQITHL